MTTREFLEAIGSLSGLLFIISSMLAMGMSLTMAQILQPLKNVRLVLMALLANFVLVPLLAYIIILVIPLVYPGGCGKIRDKNGILRVPCALCGRIGS